MKNVIHFAIFGLLLVFCLCITSNSYAWGVLADDAVLTKSFAAVGAKGTARGIVFDGESYFAIWGTEDDPIVQYDADGNYVTEAYPMMPNYMYSGMASIVQHGDDLFVLGDVSAWSPTLIHQVNKSNLVEMPTIGQVGFRVPFPVAATFELQGDTLYARNFLNIFVLDWPSGNYLDEFTLDTTLRSDGWPDGITLALADDYILIQKGDTVQAFDFTGNMVGECTGIPGHGIPSFSFSYTDDLLWMNSGGEWKGYDIGLNPVPIPGAVWLLGSGLLGLIGIRRKKAA
jgi:hypothetical protein